MYLQVVFCLSSLFKEVFVYQQFHKISSSVITTCERSNCYFIATIACPSSVFTFFFTSPTQRNFNAKYRKTCKGGGKKKVRFLPWLTVKCATAAAVSLIILRRSKRFFDFRDRSESNFGDDRNEKRLWVEQNSQGISRIVRRLIELLIHYRFPNFHFGRFILINFHILANVFD